MSTSTPRLGLVKPAAGELYSRAVLNNNYDIIDSNILNVIDKMAQGKKVGAFRATNSGAFSVLTVIENVATFTFKAGRHYTINWHGSFQVSVADTILQTQIGTCLVSDPAAQTTGIAVIASRYFDATVANSTRTYDHSAPYDPVTDETVQLKFLAVRAAGTGTITITGLTARCFLEILDMGAQF